MQKVSVLLVDDLDGSQAEETVTFALDGVEYQIDLSDANARKLREQLADYLDHARRIGKVGKVGKKGAQPTASTLSAQHRNETKAVRQWANQNGFDLADRGRIPVAIQQAYEESRAG